MNKSMSEIQIEILQATAKILAEAEDLNKILEDILKLLDEQLKLYRGTITLLDESTETINISIAHGLSKKAQELGKYNIGEGITGKVVQSGKPVVIPDIRQDDRFLNKTGARANLGNTRVAFVCVPIKIGRKTIGALSVDKEVKEHKSLSEDLKILNIMSPMIAQAIKLNRRVKRAQKNLQDENLRLKQELKEKFNVHNMVGKSNAMQSVYHMIEQVANSNTTVLIRGESGTGKELVAHAIHYLSPRASKPFIKLNCSAFPETLLESELFGHEKGAFTGALERKIGRFEWAQGGTLFLDEIGDFPLNIQIKMLRVIQTREFERLGGRETIKANVRIIAATNQNLEEEIKQQRFREDLYYRINVFPIFLPPLRERKDDIMLLANHFVEKLIKENNKAITRISTPAIDMLSSYHWPGNIRELENCIERAVLLCEGGVIRSEHLPPTLHLPDIKESSINSTGTFKDIIAQKEKELLVDALKKTRGNQKKAAELLNLTERIFSYKMNRYSIHAKNYK